MLRPEFANRIFGTNRLKRSSRALHNQPHSSLRNCFGTKCGKILQRPSHHGPGGIALNHSLGLEVGNANLLQCHLVGVLKQQTKKSSSERVEHWAWEYKYQRKDRENTDEERRTLTIPLVDMVLNQQAQVQRDTRFRTEKQNKTQQENTSQARNCARKTKNNEWSC